MRKSVASKKRGLRVKRTAASYLDQVVPVRNCMSLLEEQEEDEDSDPVVKYCGIFGRGRGTERRRCRMDEMRQVEE
jgi:hypothetical protein